MASDPSIRSLAFTHRPCQPRKPSIGARMALVMTPGAQPFAAFNGHSGGPFTSDEQAAPPREGAPLTKLETLKSMFPDLEADILTQMLSFHGDSLERTVSSLLETWRALLHRLRVSDLPYASGL